MTHNISAATKPADAPKLLDRVRDRIRLKHDSKRTELAYWDWIKRTILFHPKRHPAQRAFLDLF